MMLCSTLWFWLTCTSLSSYWQLILILNIKNKWLLLSEKYVYNEFCEVESLSSSSIFSFSSLIACYSRLFSINYSKGNSFELTSVEVSSLEYVELVGFSQELSLKTSSYTVFARKSSSSYSSSTKSFLLEIKIINYNLFKSSNFSSSF